MIEGKIGRKNNYNITDIKKARENVLQFIQFVAIFAKESVIFINAEAVI